jgi:rhodanese-related sulfurtransferase
LRPELQVIVTGSIDTQESAMPASVKEMLAAANASVPKISPQDAAGLIGKGNVLIVDVRDGQELQATGKVRGATHVPRGMIEFRADPESPYHDKAFARDKTVVVYCASGGRSALAGKTLQDMGYKDVRNLGGFKDWVESGGAVEKL